MKAWVAKLERRVMVAVLWAFVYLVVLGTLNARTTYYQCDSCHAAFRQKGFEHGFPGTFRFECPCGGKIVECSKIESGWLDGVEPTIFGR